MEEVEDKIGTIITRSADEWDVTQGTLLANAQAGDERALNQLLEIYRGPIVNQLRRRLGTGASDCEDAAQEYLCGLLRRGYLRDYSSPKGKFRAFIQHDLRLFVYGWQRKGRAIKRGGNVQLFSYDELIEEGRQVGADGEGPEDELFDREWTECLMQRARDELREHYSTVKKAERFDTLEEFIEFGGDWERYEQAAKVLGMTPNAVKTAVHRIRQLYAQILRRLVEQSLGPGESVEEELDYLRRCFVRAKRDSS